MERELRKGQAVLRRAPRLSVGTASPPSAKVRRANCASVRSRFHLTGQTNAADLADSTLTGDPHTGHHALTPLPATTHQP